MPILLILALLLAPSLAFADVDGSFVPPDTGVHPDAAAAADAGTAKDDGGCSCRLAGPGFLEGSVLFTALGAAALILRRRRG